MLKKLKTTYRERTNMFLKSLWKILPRTFQTISQYLSIRLHGRGVTHLDLTQSELRFCTGRTPAAVFCRFAFRRISNNGFWRMDSKRDLTVFPWPFDSKVLCIWFLVKKTASYIYSYLDPRKLNVEINKIYSSFETLLFGAPRGSILGILNPIIIHSLMIWFLFKTKLSSVILQTIVLSWQSLKITTFWTFWTLTGPHTRTCCTNDVLTWSTNFNPWYWGKGN